MPDQQQWVTQYSRTDTSAFDDYGTEGQYSSGVQQRHRGSVSAHTSVRVDFRLGDGRQRLCAEFGEGRRAPAANLAANPPAVGGRRHARMDCGQSARTQPAGLLAIVMRRSAVADPDQANASHAGFCGGLD